MGRPTGADWRPLGLDDDPTPGDPGRVTQEVSHLNSVASTILNQIRALRKIAGDDSDQLLVGEYADKIKETASDLVDTLGKVHDRYQRVAAALGGWESDLVTAQAMSLKALNEAEGPHAQLQLLNGPTISAPQTSPPTPPTPAQQQAATAHKAAVTKAQNQLNEAVNDLHTATQFRDDRANYWSGKINGASDDGLKDSWWDSFKDFIGKWAWLIKDICTVLEVVGAVLAILALLLTGVGWLLLAAFIVTAVALLGRTLLAATGNGSWLDVVLDAVALATLGLSGGLSGTARLVGSAEKTVDEAAEVFNTVQKVAADGSELGQAAGRLGDVADELRAMSEEFDDSELLDQAEEADKLALQARDLAVSKFPPANAVMGGASNASALTRILTGGPDLANDVARMNALKDALPSSAKLTELGVKLMGEVNPARALILGGAAWSVGGIAVSGAPYYGPGEFGAEEPAGQLLPWHFNWFDSAEEAMTAPIPDSWIPGGTPQFTVTSGSIGK
jgi:hypothetical protein